MTRQLGVWLFGTHIGTLSQIDGRLNFSYVSDWLNMSNSIPLSQSLPLQAEVLMIVPPVHFLQGFCLKETSVS